MAKVEILLCNTSAKWWTLLPVEPFKYQRVVVFDTETSGFGAEDEIIEIGAVELEVRSKAENGSSLWSSLWPTGVCFHSLLQATRPINAKASQVNGLDFEMLQAVASKQDAIRRFMNFIGDEKTALIAHNAAFDLRMLLQDLKRCGLEAEGIRLGQRCFCSAAAFGAFRPLSPRDLTTACYLLDIPEGSPGSVWRSSTHSALVDAVLTAKVVLAILSKVAGEAGQPLPRPTALPLPCRPSSSTRLPSEAFTSPEQTGRKRRLPALLYCFRLSDSKAA